MSDKFLLAIEELGSAINSGEDIDAAVPEIAAEHDLKPEALRNRAERALGDLATYRARHTAVAGKLAKAARERQENEMRLRSEVERMRAYGYPRWTSEDSRAVEEFLSMESIDSSTDQRDEAKAKTK